MDRDSASYGTPGVGRNSAIMSPASRNIEKSLNELDDLINKRRLELSHLRSNNRVYSADRILQEARDKTTPTTHTGTNHIHTLSSSSSAASIRSSSSHSNISPYLASSLPNTIISSSGTPPGYSPYGSSVPTDRAIAPTYSNTKPPLYTSPMSYGNNDYNGFSHNKDSVLNVATDNRNIGGMINAGTINQHGYIHDNPDMVTIPSTKYNQLEQQLQYFQNKAKELELEKQAASEELTSTKDDLLFLRTQLQTKSDEIANLKEHEFNLNNQIQHLQAVSAHNNVDNDYKAYYEDAVKENELWVQKVDEIAKEKRALEDDLKRAEKAIFDWEAGWGQLEGDCIALQDQVRQKDNVISSMSSKKYKAIALSLGTLRNTVCRVMCRVMFTAWRQSISSKKKNLHFAGANNVIKDSSVDDSGLRRRNNQKPDIKEEVTPTPYRLPPSDTADQLQQQLQFDNEIENRKKHNVSYLVILAFFQFIVWMIVLVFGYIYLEKNSVDVRELLQGYSLTLGSTTYEANEVIDTFKSYF